MKDYYSILECGPMSTRDEIKRNYRRLAQLYHPDKHSGDVYATARFHDIKEAYETLTQPAKKNAWLEERWLNQFMNIRKGETAPLTPYLLLDKTLKLDKLVSTADSFRMDRYGMVTKMENMLSAENIECLKNFNEPDINRTIVNRLLHTARSFPLPMLGKFLEKLNELAETDQDSTQKILAFKKEMKRRHQKQQYLMPVILLVTLLICLLIYVSGRQS